MLPTDPDSHRGGIEPSALDTTVGPHGPGVTREPSGETRTTEVFIRRGLDRPRIDGKADLAAPGPPGSEHGSGPDRVGNPRAANQELRDLLRRRLILIGCITIWAHGIYIASKLFRPLSSTYDPAGPALLAVHGLTTAASVVWLIVALASRSKGLRWHRGLELGAWGIMFLSRLGIDHLVNAGLGRTAADSGDMFAYASILRWYSLIVVYGFIPNTTRRAAAVVAAMAIVACSSMLSLWLRLDLRPGQLGGFLTSMIIYLGTASALTVFTAGRLEEARQAIVRARELGQYRLGRKLGGGGMGEVYLAEHRLLKRPCAVKLIRPEKAGDETFVRRFEREVAAVTRLVHPAAVQVYDYGRAEDGAFFFVMEYLPGLTLDELVKRSGPPPPGRALSLLRQVCGALSEAHDLGLIHRDVKPGNIMICRLGGRADVAKLLDFGLVAEPARQETRLTQTGGLLGTPAYMSPEQARGAEVGPSSDLYSLGAVGYFLLTGRPPFDGKNTLELLHAHQNRPVVPPSEFVPSVPRDLEAIVLRLLAKDPEDRYPRSSDVERDLAACDPGGWTSVDAEAWWDEEANGTDDRRP